MKITIESTTKIVSFNGIDCRIWEGATESGIPVHVYIPRVSVHESRPPEDFAQFERELKECAKPSAEVQAIPLRMIL
jgi:hypothetical protein